MDNLIIDETKYTPFISLNAQEGICELRGKSFPENTFEFYTPIMEWIEEYFTVNSQKKITFNFEIIYFNSSSSKAMFNLFNLLDKEQKEGKDFEVNWIYDEENDFGKESGEDFKEDFEDLNFNLVQK